MGLARRIGRSRSPSRGLAVESGGLIGRGSTMTPQSSARGGGWGTDVEVGAGADLFEHEGPLQGLGRGAGSVVVVDPSSRSESRLMLGRSLGWSQLAAFADPGAIKAIARNVKDAPTIAFISRIGRVARIESPMALSRIVDSGTHSRRVDYASNIQRPPGHRKIQGRAIAKNPRCWGRGGSLALRPTASTVASGRPGGPRPGRSPTGRGWPARGPSRASPW
jgi:hypothetical protein